MNKVTKPYVKPQVARAGSLAQVTAASKVSRAATVS